jgi:hypothetical protein
MSKKHIHKYYKVDVNFNLVWACALPDCNHHMPKHYENMMPGKATICWDCGEITVLDPINMKLTKPICPDCRGERSIEEYLEQKGVVSPVSGH